MRTGGRIRSETAHADILAATLAMLEEIGYRALHIEGVAARAGVAKSTIYRWWPTKGALVMEAFEKGVARRVPEPDTGALRTDLTVFTRQLYRVSDHPARAHALRGLMVEAQLDADFAPLFRQWVATRQAVVARILARAAERGEISAGVDVDTVVDLIFGPFWYRLLVGHRPLRTRDADRHVALVLAGLSS